MSMFLLTEYLLWKSIKRSSGFTTEKEEFKQNKEEVFDDDKVCRVCMNTADIPVTDKIDDTIIMSAIRTVANISINEADYYPKYVCKNCLEELKIAFYFKRKCEASDLMFRKMISSETHVAFSSSRQPMVMHDFQRILHQMKLQREALQNAAITNNVSKDEHLDTRNSFVLETSSPVIPEVSKTPRKVIKMIRKQKTSKSNRNINIKIVKMKILPNAKLKISKNIGSSICKQSKKKTTKKKKIEHKCRRCDAKFDSKGALIEHKNKNNCMYQPCPLCGKLVLNLPQHENIVHLRPNKYTCHQCGKVYYSSGSLVNHLQVHKETFEYSCDLCPYRGKRKSYLVCHMRVHTGEHRYLCSKCPAKFTNASNLRKHQLMHIGKKFECSKCKKLFRQQKTMQEHYDSAHLNIRYRCSICGRDLSTRKKLLSHELRVHKREKHKLFHELHRVVINNEND